MMFIFLSRNDYIKHVQKTLHLSKYNCKLMQVQKILSLKYMSVLICLIFLYIVTNFIYLFQHIEFIIQEKKIDTMKDIVVLMIFIYNVKLCVL